MAVLEKLELKGDARSVIRKISHGTVLSSVVPDGRNGNFRWMLQDSTF